MFMVCSVSVLSMASIADDNLEDAFRDAKVSGEIRYKYIVKDDGKLGGDAEGSAVGGSLGVEMAPLYGFSAGAMFYTTNRVTGSDNPLSAEDKQLTNTQLIDGDRSYTILGQSYLVYKNKNTTLKAGRQYLDTPFIGADDARIIPNLFEAYMFTNSDISDTKITIGHVSKMAGWDSLGGDITTFVPMTQAAGITTSQNGVEQYNKGVSLASIIYSGITDTVLEAWYYRAHDLVDIYYIQGVYDTKVADVSLMVGAQFWHTNSTSKYNKWASGTQEDQIDYSVYGLMSEATIYDATLMLAYHSMDMRQNLPAIHGIWGAYPEYVFAQESFVTSYNLSGVDAIKAGAVYDSTFGEFSIGYVMFNSHDEALVNSQNVLDLIYAHDVKYVKNLSVSLLYENARVSQDSRVNEDYDFYKASITYAF